jgi:translation initiation factor 2 subunit 3
VIDFAQETQLKKEKKEKPLPEVNIGLVGHVDHGKTSLTQTLTGKWTDTHSEELKRGITIRLGYADFTSFHCDACNFYFNSSKCPKCFGDAKPVRTISIIDAPGHETLMATVLSGAALMDGAILVISADEGCPQPQTAEHLKALDVVGIKNIIIVQNKIDLVSEEAAKKNYEQIKKFVKGTIAENAPIIPVSAIHNANIDVLIETIEEKIKTPKRDESKPAKFYVARSFDVNRPGTPINDLKGAVIGGSLTQGIISLGDEIEIKPGTKMNEKWIPLKSRVVEIIQNGPQKEVKPGGLVALQTELDPSLSRADGLSGAIAGHVGNLPEAVEDLKMKVHLFDHVIGTEGKQEVKPIKTGDAVMMTAAIAKTVGFVTSAAKESVQVRLKIPVVVEKNDKIAISMQVGGRWHLIGYGIVS